MSHFWRKLKKGFTAVELAIVIAVIAILIAIIVPTFINILNSARKSNDSSLVYNANQTLQIEETLSGESYNNVTDAITTLLNNDYTLDDLTATADGCTLAYDTSTNSFVLLEDYTADGIDDTTIKNICVVNPDSTTLTEAAESGITNFCVYDTSDTVTVETDLQVTFYVYTKENSTTTIDAASATVNYYGKSETVNISAVDSKSFHTYGTADTINLTKGHIEFCDGSETGTFNILGDETWYTFSGNATIGETIYQNNDSTYIPSKINYNGGNADINLYTRPNDYSDNTATEIAAIAAALYPYGVSYRANNDKAIITLNYNYKNDNETTITSTTTTTSGDWKVTLETPTREGYRFDGWYLDSDCTGTQVSSGATIKSDLTLYAKWTQIYNVTFNLNYDGETETTTPDAQTIIAGNTATEPESPVRAAYNFTGWYTDIGCTDAYDFSNVVEADITLYAGWEIKTYTVNFYNEYTYSDTYLTICSLTIEHGESIAAELLSTYIPNEVGSDGKPYYPNGTEDKSKTFDGWYTDSNFTTKFEFGSAITCNMDIYANWVDVNVTIKLDLNDGTLYDNTFTNENKYTATVVYGSTVDIADPVKSENEFLGWYTDENCTEVFILDTTTVTANITLYAGWECTQATINGVIYTKTTNSNTDNTITFGNTITVDNITKYWVVTGYTEDISAYYSDTWLVLENEIYGYPVLEIAAGALANTNGSNASADNSLTNVLVPENIVMVGSRAFLDNKGITSIVFLADTVYFSNITSESTYNTYYNSVKAATYFDGLTYKNRDSQNYPFYGCGTDSNDEETNLTVYYKTAYSTDPATGSTLNNGVFVIKRKSSSEYYRTKNDTSTTSSSNIQTITWLYINTTTISQSLTCGEYERGDFDWASALTDVLTGYGVSCCSNDGYVFMASGLTDDLSAYITAQLKVAINSFTAEYGEYINGYKVSSIEACTSLVNGNDVTFKIGTDTIYYLLDVNQSVVDGSNAVTSAGWDIVKGVNNDGGTIVTYSVKVGDTNATAVTMEVTYSGSVQYFDYDTNYSSYYSTTNSGKAVYGTGDITISGESGYNYKTDGCSLSNVSSVTEVALVWTQTDDPYIYIVSDIDFTYSDGTNTTYISASKTGSPLLYSHVNSVVGNSLLNGGEIDCSADGYYFLGWAYIGAYIDSDNNNALTFTTITANETTFDSASVYYAIWAYVDWSVYSVSETESLSLSFDVAGDGTSLPTPTIVNGSDTVGTFVDWYTDEEFATSASELTSGNYTYYAKTAENEVTVNGVVYTFTSGNFTFVPSNTSNKLYNSGSGYTITVEEGGYYSIIGYTDDLKNYYSNDEWLVLENIINNFKVLEIATNALHATNGKYNADSSITSCALVNVVVPENIIYVGGNAFTDNTSLLNVVFLASNIYINNNTKTSNNGRTEYSFKDCSSSLNVYIKNYVGLGENDTSSSYDYTIAFTYDNNQNKLTPVTYWLYIDTAIGTTTIAGSTFELDNALIAALEDYATTNNITYYQNGDYLFIAASDENLINSVASYITSAIDDFSAQYGSYINGHTVEVETDGNDDYNLSVNVSDNETAYYLVEIEAYISEEAVTATAAITNNTDNDGNIISVTYTNKVTGENETTTYTFTVTISNAEYFADNSGLYVKNGLANITASSDKNTHYLSSVTYGETTYTYATDGSTSGDIALDGSAMEYSVEVAFGAATGTLSLGWIAVENTSTITIYSAVAATVGSGDTSLSKTEGNTLYSTELTMDTAYSYGNGSSTSGYYVPDLTTDENNYYFLGYAAYMDNGSITDSTDGTLTFTDIAINTTTFNDSNTYYAIWGYSSETIDKSNTKTGSNELATPTLANITTYSYTNRVNNSDTTIEYTATNMTRANFYYWYTEGNFSSTNITELQSGIYTYYARMSYTLLIQAFASKTIVKMYNGSDQSGTYTSYYVQDGNNNHTVSFAIDIYEGDTLKVTSESDYKNLCIYINGEKKYNAIANKYESNSENTNTSRYFANNSNHTVTVTDYYASEAITGSAFYNNTLIYGNTSDSSALTISHSILLYFKM